MVTSTLRHCGRAALLAMALLVAAPVTGPAQEFAATGVQLLHGNGYELGPARADILTLEHGSTWRLGSNFFFFDVSEPFARGTGVYGEWYSRLAWSRLGLGGAGRGLVRDVSFTVAINAGEGFRAYLAGATLHLRVPGFALFDVDLMAYDDRADDDVTFIVTPAWELPFRVGGAALRCRGFVDLIGREGGRAAQILAQPQLLLDLGRLWGEEGRWFVGLEYQYWRHKYGAAGVTESLPQLMLAWQF